MSEEEKKAANLVPLYYILPYMNDPKCHFQATVVLTNMSTIKAYSLQTHFDNVFCDALRPLQRLAKRRLVIRKLNITYE